MYKILIICIIGAIMAVAQESKEPLVKISEIVVDCKKLAEYKAILQEESKQSVKVESGVLILYAMQHTDNPCRFSIVEVYKDEQSYNSHIASPHFQHYKQSTLHMVKDLKFIPMKALNPQMFLDKNL